MMGLCVLASRGFYVGWRLCVILLVEIAERLDLVIARAGEFR